MSTIEISDEQIRALRDEAGSAGDLEMVRVCDSALGGSNRARSECAKVIAYTQMRADEDTALGTEEAHAEQAFQAAADADSEAAWQAHSRADAERHGWA
jgi:hypothetical protein